MSEHIIDVPMRHQRDIRTVTAEIRTLTAQAQRQILEYAIEIGRRLCEAKSMLPHGQWGQWLRDEVEFSQSTANNFMKIFDEYGADQLTLDGAVAKSQTLGKLSYTKALKLLAVPAEEREKFMEENGVEHMSSRELERAIRERDEAVKRAEQAEAEATEAKDREDTWKSEIATYRADLDQLTARAERAEAATASAKDAQAETLKQLDRLTREAQEARHAEETAKEKLKKLLESPEVPAALEEKLRNEAGREAEAAFAEEKKKLEQQAKAAAEEARLAQERAEALRKQLALASPETAVFKTLFEAVQEDFNRLHGALIKADGVDPEQAAKLRKATYALLESFRTRIG